MEIGMLIYTYINLLRIAGFDISILSVQYGAKGVRYMEAFLYALTSCQQPPLV